MDWWDGTAWEPNSRLRRKLLVGGGASRHERDRTSGANEHHEIHGNIRTSNTTGEQQKHQNKTTTSDQSKRLVASLASEREALLSTTPLFFNIMFFGGGKDKEWTTRRTAKRSRLRGPAPGSSFPSISHLPHCQIHLNISPTRPEAALGEEWAADQEPT